mmetsp:Transcript_67976/g.196953  ORF Transcript_67976/g.196953 Transcript_67976/m.196953 type:complete len:234 (-) Transcript_67976:18-719(-)
MTFCPPVRISMMIMWMNFSKLGSPNCLLKFEILMGGTGIMALGVPTPSTKCKLLATVTPVISTSPTSTWVLDFVSSCGGSSFASFFASFSFIKFIKLSTFDDVKPFSHVNWHPSKVTDTISTSWKRFFNADVMFTTTDKVPTFIKSCGEYGGRFFTPRPLTTTVVVPPSVKSTSSMLTSEPPTNSGPFSRTISAIFFFNIGFVKSFHEATPATIAPPDAARSVRKTMAAGRGV